MGRGSGPRAVALGGLLAACAAAGCVSGAGGAGFEDVRREVAEREGKDVRWDHGGPDDARAAAAVQALLASGPDVERAVQVALLRNPSLQGTFEEIGVAQADLVQAGLLRNPVFHVAAQGGTGGTSGVRLDWSAVAGFLDVLRIPMRRRVAAADLERATIEAADAVLALAHDVREAWWTRAARAQVLAGRERSLESLEASAELSRRQERAGNATELDRMALEDAALDARLEAAGTRTLLQADRERLVRLLGLPGPDVDRILGSEVAELPAAEPPLEDLERLAVGRRLDLAAARARIRSLRAGLPLTAVDPWAESTLGVSGERDPGGDHHVGPDLALEVPLFDTGRAAAARESARVRAGLRRYEALEAAARSQVREARARLLAAREAEAAHRSERLPRRRRATALVQQRYDAMTEGPYRLLAAKRAEIDAEREAVEALRDYWIARADLERAVGGRLPSASGAAQTTAPDTPLPPAPTTAPDTPGARPPATTPEAPPPAAPDHRHHGGG